VAEPPEDFSKAWKLRKELAQKSTIYGETKENGLDFETKINDISTRELFYLLYLQKKGSFGSFMEWHMNTIQLDKDVKVSAFVPAPPAYFLDLSRKNDVQNIKLLANSNQNELISWREINFIHPVREKSMFAP
jgi:hypothetical protein